MSDPAAQFVPFSTQILLLRLNYGRLLREKDKLSATLATWPDQLGPTTRDRRLVPS